MKRYIAVFLICLSLVIGLTGGFVFRGLLSVDRSTVSTFRTAADTSNFTPSNNINFSLLDISEDVIEVIRAQDYSTLASYLDSDHGLTITPFSTVDPSTNIVLSADELRNASKSTNTYVWGTVPGTAEPIRQTISEFFSATLWKTDYSAAPEIGIDTVLYSGNAQENVADAYPDCHFVDFYVPGQDEDNQNWSSLKLVFRWNTESSQWCLVGIVHSEWTP